MARNVSPYESAEQIALFKWAEYCAKTCPELALLHHIPNGGSRNLKEAHNLRLQGVKAGVPDICLPVPKGNFHGMYIELKRTRGGIVSKDQKLWIDRLSNLGYKAVVCNGWDAARKAIEEYLHQT